MVRLKRLGLERPPKVLFKLFGAVEQRTGACGFIPKPADKSNNAHTESPQKAKN